MGQILICGSNTNKHSNKCIVTRVHHLSCTSVCSHTEVRTHSNNLQRHTQTVCNDQDVHAVAGAVSISRALQ